MRQQPPRLQRWLRFLAVGAINTAATYGIYLLLQQYLYYQLAYAIAFGAGIVFSYAFNALLVFRVPLSAKGLRNYPIVYVGQYAASALVLSLIVKIGGVPVEIAPLLVTAMTVPLTYVMSRWVLQTSAGRG